MTPKNWKPQKLKELGFVGRGKSKHRPRNEPSLYGGKYPFVQTGDIKAAELYLREYSQTYNDKGLAQSKLWQSDTLCITIAANIAETAILGMEACFPDSVVGFVADENKSDVRFVKYYIDTIKLRMQNISQGTTQDNLSLEKLNTFDVLTPPLPTQHRIADILSAYDDLIENNTRRIRILEQMAQAIYQEWFGKVDKESLPKGWKIVTVGDFGEIITGKTPSKAVEEYFGNDVPFIKIPDMHGNLFCIHTEEMLSFEGEKSQSKKTIPPNSLCVSCIGTAGLVTITTVPSQTNQQINTVVPHNLTEREFLYFALDGLRETINLYGANGATIVNLNKGKFEALNIVKPTDELIRHYHEVAYPIFEKIRVLQIKNANLRQTRDLLLPRLVSGEIEV